MHGFVLGSLIPETQSVSIKQGGVGPHMWISPSHSHTTWGKSLPYKDMQLPLSRLVGINPPANRGQRAARTQEYDTRKSTW